MFKKSIFILSLIAVLFIFRGVANANGNTLFFPEAGPVALGTNLRIIDNRGLTHLYYTTDGSDPTTDSPDFSVTGQFPLNGPFPETVKVLIYDDYENFIGTTSATFTEASLDDGLVGHWTFDEGTGMTATDSSRNNNDGIWIDSSESYSTDSTQGDYSGVFSKGDGEETSNIFVVVPDNSSINNFSNNFSASLWVKPTSWNTWNVLLSKDLWGDNLGWLLYVEGEDYNIHKGNLIFSQGGGYESIYIDPVIPLNQWSNIIFTANNGLVNVYMNGNLIGTAPDLMFNSDQSVDLNIGARDSNTDGFNGLIDDVRLYNRPLGISEVQSLAEVEPLPPEPTLRRHISSGSRSRGDGLNVNTSKVASVITPVISTDNTILDIQKVIKDLKFGMTNNDVKTLQLFLIKENKSVAAQVLMTNGVTGYFGKLTRAALMEWQKINNIIPAAGYFGPKTRAKIKELGL